MSAIKQIENELASKRYDSAVVHIQQNLSSSSIGRSQLESLLLVAQRDRAHDATEYKRFIRRVVADTSLLEELQECHTQYSDCTQQFLESTAFDDLLRDISDKAPTGVSAVLHILTSSPGRCSILIRALKDKNLVSAVYLELGKFICSTLENSDLADKHKQLIAIEYGYALGSSIRQTRNTSHFISLRDSIKSKLAPFIVSGTAKSGCFSDILLETSHISRPSFNNGPLTQSVPVASNIMAILLQSADCNSKARQEIVTFLQLRLANGQPKGMCDVLYLVSSLFLLNIATGLHVLRLEGFLEEISAETDEYEEMLVPMLEMLSTACMSKDAQEIVSLKCANMLQGYLHISTDPVVLALVIIVLCKIGHVNSDWDPVAKKDAVSFLTSSIQQSQQIDHTLEALMFLSTDSFLKGIITGQMQGIFGMLVLLDPAVFNTLALTVAVLVHNLIDASPEAEQAESSKRILKATGATIDTQESVLERVQTLLDGGLLNVLSLLFQFKSKIVQEYVADIVYWVSHISDTRISLIKIGVLRFLYSNLQIATDDVSLAKKTRNSHALAKVLISVDPNLAFNSSNSSTIDAIVPLLNLLEPNIDSSLAVFESTLALTNLSTLGEMECTMIVRAWDNILNNLDSNITLIKRASTELICNLAVSDVGASRILSPETIGTQNLSILMDLMMSDDLATRQAACGAVAVLSYHESACVLLASKFEILDKVLLLLDDASNEIIKRALVLLQNLIEKSIISGDQHLDQLILIISGLATRKDLTEAEMMLQDLRRKRNRDDDP